MKLFDIVTIVEDIQDYIEFARVKKGDWLTIKIDAVDNIKVLKDKKVFAKLPRSVALEITMKMDSGTFVQTECVKDGYELVLRIMGYSLERVAAK